MRDPQALEKEIKRLQGEIAALQVQSRLLENFVNFARSSAKERVLTRLLQKTLEISTELTGADKGSLFLLDEDGTVADGILTRVDTTPEQRSKIIGKVLDKGLAGWVQRNHKVGLIADTRTDSRWVDLPNQPYAVGSALAVPILMGETLLGILTLLHEQPAHFSQDTADLMQITAAQIGNALGNASLYSKLYESYRSLGEAKLKIEAYSKALDEELEKGKKIQRDFLPRKIPRIPGWEIAFFFQPARQVSGDFYDVFMLPENLLGLVIADVCDKGVGSALFMALFRSLIRVFSGKVSLQGMFEPGSAKAGVDLKDDYFYKALNAVSLTNDYITEEHGEESMFATLFFGVLDPRTGKMAYVNAGHEPLLMVNQSGLKGSLGSTGPVVGMMPAMKYQVAQVDLEHGDMLIGYTDGLTDAMSPQEKSFGKERFLTLLEKPAQTAPQLIEQIKIQLFDHIKHAPQFDDITMMAVHRKNNKVKS